MFLKTTKIATVKGKTDFATLLSLYDGLWILSSLNKLLSFRFVNDTDERVTSLLDK